MWRAICRRTRSRISADAGEQVKAGTVINLQASKGPEQARTPFVRSVSQDAEVGLNEELTLRVEAETSDNGTLSYAWYVSENGSVDGASLVSRSAEDNDSCIVDTSRTVRSTISVRSRTRSATRPRASIRR